MKSHGVVGKNAFRDAIRNGSVFGDIWRAVKLSLLWKSRLISTGYDNSSLRNNTPYELGGSD
jgi:hypothetical protein